MKSSFFVAEGGNGEGGNGEGRGGAMVGVVSVNSHTLHTQLNANIGRSVKFWLREEREMNTCTLAVPLSKLTSEDRAKILGYL